MTQYDKSQGQFPKTVSSVTQKSENRNSRVRPLHEGRRIVRLCSCTIGKVVMGVLDVIMALRRRKSSATDRASKFSYPRMAFVEKTKDAMPGQMTIGSISHLLDSDKLPMANFVVDRFYRNKSFRCD